MTHNSADLFIYGSGGHSKVVMDAALNCGFDIKAIFDDDRIKHGKTVFKIPVLGDRQHALRIASASINSEKKMIIAIGENKIREELFLFFKENDVNFSKVIHPSAAVGSHVEVSCGTVVLASAIINSGCFVGENVIVNSGAIIEHDCVLMEHVHIAPGSILCGDVQVGSGTLIGAGSIVTPGVKIGKNVTVGAGSVVLSNVSDGLTVVGQPAKSKNLHRQTDVSGGF